MTHLMLDTETLGVRVGSIVLSAALVRFDDFASTSIVLNRDEQAALGLEHDPGTLAWWGTQSPEAIAAAWNNPVPLVPALQHLVAWIQWAAPNPDDRLIWCHGAGFDAPLLQEVFRRAGIDTPWRYNAVRDTRTLYDLAGVDLRDSKYLHGTAHNALDDAIGQTKAALDALRVLADRRVTFPCGRCGNAANADGCQVCGSGPGG